MSVTIRVKRRVSGAAGAPASLKSGELAWNQVDGILYAGYGDNGSGVATSIVALGGPGHFAVLDSPELTGAPKGPTPPGGDNTTRLATTAFVQNAVGAAGGGDMLKSVYDPNDDGKVTAAAAADSAPWSGITGKPSEFTPENFDASKIITGIVDPARLPAVLFASPVVSSGGIADLTAGQQDDIAGGTSVVTSDGREWRYTGAGDKTLEASYVEMADRTPDWSTISNKPGSYPPSAHTHTLSQISDAGSMAAQDAANVAITGGTMSGVALDNMTVDGGTF